MNAASAPIRTQVGIVGAGPAGLMLGHLLSLRGVDSVVLEARDQTYVEGRVRAGVLEQGTADLLVGSGVGERLRRDGLVHHGIELLFDGRAHRIAFDELTGGRGIVVYGQQEIVKDLIAARRDSGADLLFEVADVSVHEIDSRRPRVTFAHGGERRELECDFVAGCDGSHGACRGCILKHGVRVQEHRYPFAWLGILAEAPPSTQELIYASSERGFALHSMRSPTLSRLYVQCDQDDELGQWPDERIWGELHARLAREGDWSLAEGPIIERGITPMRSLVTTPMQVGRLFLAGDAAHVVPPTGAKGMNLAIADAQVLADALGAWYESGNETGLGSYTERCLRRVWRRQHFSWWMTSMLHRFPDDDEFQRELQRAQLSYVCSSRAAAATLAENYVGFEGARST